MTVLRLVLFVFILGVLLTIVKLCFETENDVLAGKSLPQKSFSDQEFPQVDESVSTSQKNILSGQEVPQVNESSLKFDFQQPQGFSGTQLRKTLCREGKLGEFPSFSQTGEDTFAFWNFFSDVQQGYFLEMGALDGIRFSTTLAFEKALDWSGILIEASIKQFASLKQNRPNQLLVNIAVCDVPSVVHYSEGHDTAIGGIFEFMTAKHKSHWHKNVNISALPTLPCIPLMNVLSKFNIQHIDFFSLDVEGAEFMVLKTMDFQSVFIGVMCIEADGSDPEKERQIHALLLENGFYFHGKQSWNDWFVNTHLQKNPCIES